MNDAGLRLRLDRLAERVDAWNARAIHRPRTLYLSERHARTFTDAMADRIAAAREHGRRDLGDPRNRRALAWAITEAEAIWQLLRYVVDQRTDPERGPLLQFADLCAADGYGAVRRALPPAERDQLSVPPLVVLEAACRP